jgi:hypothetical protein
MPPISKRTPKNQTAAAHESNKRRLTRLLRQMLRKDFICAFKGGNKRRPNDSDALQIMEAAGRS